MFLNILVGAVSIPLKSIFQVLLGNEQVNPVCAFIIKDSRIPQAITSLLCGSALSVCGLLLQAIFHNPLADVSVLGISGGAGVGVAAAVALTGGSLFDIGTLSGVYGILASSFIGSMTIAVFIFSLSTKIRNSMVLLVFGIIISYAASSVTALINFFATKEGLRAFFLWGMGSFGNVPNELMGVFSIIVLVCLLASLLLIKPLNAFLLGEQYAKTIGVDVQALRNCILAVTGVLSAVVVAFCGPVGFIGLMVPHISRMFTQSDNFRVLMPMSVIIGGAVALICNLACNLPFSSGRVPLNAVTSLMGVPIIFYVMLHGNKYNNS